VVMLIAFAAPIDSKYHSHSGVSNVIALRLRDIRRALH
jgi:hypothetical protein